MQTEAEATAEPVADVSGMELYNDGSFRIVLTDASMSIFSECELGLYMENLSDKTVDVYSGGATVNGETVACGVWNQLRSDTRAITNGYVYELDEMDITQMSQIEEITLQLYVEYGGDGDVLQPIHETVTFDPNTIS